MSRGIVAGATVGALRWLRALVVAATASGLALLGHVMADGSAPPPGTVTVLVALVLLVSLGLSGRRWTVGPLLAMLFGSQALFHVAFGGAAAGAGPHHGHHVGEASAMTGHPGLVMLAGHAGAALLTALLLRHGEDCAWRVVELLARAWRTARVATAPAAVPAGGPATAPTAGAPAALVRLEHTVVRRGPPRFATA